MDVASPIAPSTAGQQRADSGRCFTDAMQNILATKRATNGATAFADSAALGAVPYRGVDRPPAEGYGHPR